MSINFFISTLVLVFLIYSLGVFLYLKNLILSVMSLELMLLAININFIFFSLYTDNILGHVIIIFFILVISAAESAVGLALVIIYYKGYRDILLENKMNLPIYFCLFSFLLSFFFGHASSSKGSVFINVLSIFLALLFSFFYTLKCTNNKIFYSKIIKKNKVNIRFSTLNVGNKPLYQNNRRNFSKLLNKIFSNNKRHYSNKINSFREITKIKNDANSRFIKSINNRNFYDLSEYQIFDLLLFKLKKEILLGVGLDLKDASFRTNNNIYLYSNDDFSLYGYFALVNKKKAVFTSSNNIDYTVYCIDFLMEDSYVLNSENVLLYSYINLPIDFLKNENFNERYKVEEFLFKNTIMNNKSYLINKIKSNIDSLLDMNLISPDE